MSKPQDQWPYVGQDITMPTGVASYGTIRIRSERAAEVARWFGLGKPPARRRKRRLRGGLSVSREEQPSALDLPLAAGTITLITGASGAGKSSLFREIRSRLGSARRWIDLGAMRVADVPV